MTVESNDSIHLNKTAPKFHRTSELVKAKLDNWQQGLAPYVCLPSGDVPTLIAVGGGKGGVGKSILSANLASKLALNGYRVLVVDLDLGCANVHTHFGIPKPKYSLSDFILEPTKSFSEIITPTTVPGVALVAGGQEAAWGRHLARGPETLIDLWDSILRSRQQLQVDFVVLDLGAGTLRHTMDFFSAAHLGIVTVLPEPTSIENAYVFIKAFLWHLIDNVSVRANMLEEASDVRDALSKVGSGGGFGNGYAETFRQLYASYPEFINLLFAALKGRSLGVVVNQTRSQADVDVGASMEMICKRYFGVQTTFLGGLNYDDSAWKSLRNRRLMLNDFPHSQLSKRLTGVANNTLRTLGYQI